MNVHRAEEALKAKVLVFGSAGSGKTRFLGSANDDERSSPMLFLDYEGGTMSLVGSKVDIVRINGWDDYSEVYQFLTQSAHKYKSVAMDSISEVHVFSLLSRLVGPRRGTATDLLTQQDYGVALLQMRRLLREFRDLPLHVFASALSKDDVDVREGTVKKPALGGALADEVPGIYDVVSYLGSVVDEGETHRALVLQNAPKIRVKTRLPVDREIPDFIIDPTVTKLFDVLGFATVAKSK